MANCPLAEDCPRFQEHISGMGCQHFGDRGGAEWCNHYNMPISDLKQQPVKPGEEVLVEVTDIHESGAGVGRTDDGFIVLVDGLLPDCRAVVRIDQVKRNHAKAKKVIEKLPLDPEDEEEDLDREGPAEPERKGKGKGKGTDGRPTALGSRDNFWGG